MIKRVIRQGLVKYEKEESDLKQDALLEIARIELEEKDSEKRLEKISSVLRSVDMALSAIRQKEMNPITQAEAGERPSKAEQAPCGPKTV